MSVHFVSAEGVAEVLTWADAIGALKAAYAVPLPAAASPPRVMARAEGVWLRALAAAPPSSRFMGTKVFGWSRERTVNYLISLFDQNTGKLTGLLDGCQITAVRTAATSAVALDVLVPLRAVTVGVLGSGVEAQAHLRAFAAIRPCTAVCVYSPTPARREAFAAALGAELGVPCTAVDAPAAAVAEADVVLAAARSRDESPILYADWLRPDATVASIGSTIPEQREIDVSVVDACALIVCDAVDEVVGLTGDMLAATQAGIDFESKVVSLNDVLCGRVDVRSYAAERTLFKSAGSALQDIIVAELAYDRAVARGLATVLPIELTTKRV